MSLLLKYISMRSRRSSKIREPLRREDRGRRVAHGETFRPRWTSLGDVTSQVEYQVFIHRWPPALTTGLVRITGSKSQRPLLRDWGGWWEGGGGVQRAPERISLFECLTCARGCPMRVRPGRVGRFHGDKGVHRTGIAKTERRTPALPSSTYAFPLLTVSKASRSLSHSADTSHATSCGISCRTCAPAACFPLASAP